MKKIIHPIMMCLLLQPLLAITEEANPQCEMIAHLTADYFQHRQNGLTLEEIDEQYRPPFGNAEFQRTVDLAIAMAFTLPTDSTESDVINQVYETCMSHQ
jgi:hypothetical protein